MPKPIWFPFYPADFLSSSRVALMTTEEIGGYLLLLCHAWQDPTCTIPDDDGAVRKLSRLTGSLETVKSCFIKKRGRLLNERLYKEWQKVKEKSDLARHSVEVRWQNERNTNVSTKGIRTQYSSHRNIGTREQKNKGTSEESELQSEKIKTSALPSAAASVWGRYSKAYLSRYKTEPVRNATVNSQIAHLVKRIGEDAAPEVAAFYVWHNDQFYIRSKHPVGLLLKNAEGLHTEWKTGQTVTSSQARKIDETQGRVNVFQELINERKGEIIDVKTS